MTPQYNWNPFLIPHSGIGKRGWRKKLRMDKENKDKDEDEMQIMDMKGGKGEVVMVEEK